MKKTSTKAALLHRLKKEQGTWLSGQALSRELEISRAAVSKNIQALRQEGYRIEAAPHNGYCLTAAPDRLLGAEIQQGLKTRIFGQQEILHYDVIDSTNTRARELADCNGKEGALVIAETQTAGRGRRGRVWVSPQGSGIYLSMIARPRISPAEAPQITLLTAVALADAVISLTDLPVRIKWPNDLLINGRKLAGILTELRTEMDQVDYVVIGIGMNVNTPTEALRAVTDREVTSIITEGGGKLSRVKLLHRFLEEFEDRYHLLGSSGFEAVLNRWKQLADIVGKIVRVEVAGRMRSGRVLDVERTGVLLVERDTGQIERIFSGDLFLETK